MRIEWVTRVQDLDQYESGWRELEARVTSRTVLSTYDYNATWYRWYGAADGGEMLVGIAIQHGRVVGVAPLVRRRRRIGRIPLRCVEFAPHEAYAGEFLVEDSQPDIMAAFVDALVDSAPFDVICLNDVDLEHARYDTLRSAIDRHGFGIEVTNHANAMVDLRQGYDAYLRDRSAHFRQAVRRMRRRLEDVGATAVEGVIPDGTISDVDAAVARMVAITEASHKLNGARLADVHRGFLTEIARRFGARAMLALPILRVGDRDAAFVFGLVERGCFYDVTLSYDESFAQLRVGTHLIQRMLEQFAGSGVHTVISHGAHEYKRHWATAFLPSPRLFLFAPTPRAIATRTVRFSLAPVWRTLGAAEA
jgi:CelD/BcsL family acetyltransferase involved in cellulose biosynthesis